MLLKNSIVVHFAKKSIVRFAASILCVLLLGSWLAPTFAQQPGQRAFASPKMVAEPSLIRCKNRTINFH